MRHHYKLLLTGRRTTRISDYKENEARFWWGQNAAMQMLPQHENRDLLHVCAGATHGPLPSLPGPHFRLSSLLTLVLSPEETGTIFTTWRDQK